MPRIVRLHAFGGPENLRVEEAPSRPAGPGEVRPRVEAAGVNRDHYTFTSGHQFTGHGFVQPVLPSRLGYEAAGVVEAVGEGVDRSWIGKRVAPVPGFDESRYGTPGEEAVVPAGTLSEYPSNLTGVQAAAFFCSPSAHITRGTARRRQHRADRPRVPPARVPLRSPGRICGRMTIIEKV